MLSDALINQSGISELKFNVKIQQRIFVYTITKLIPMRKVVLDQIGTDQVPINVKLTFQKSSRLCDVLQ
jgi:hypothetical protein